MGFIDATDSISTLDIATLRISEVISGSRDSSGSEAPIKDSSKVGRVTHSSKLREHTSVGLAVPKPSLGDSEASTSLESDIWPEKAKKRHRISNPAAKNTVKSKILETF